MITLSHTGATVGIKIQLGRALLPVVFGSTHMRWPGLGRSEVESNATVEFITFHFSGSLRPGSVDVRVHRVERP